MNGVEMYLAANGAVMVLVLGQMLRAERRLGKGDMIFERLLKRCKLFDGKKEGEKKC